MNYALMEIKRIIDTTFKSLDWREKEYFIKQLQELLDEKENEEAK